jgi:hypothetical protein
MFKYVFPIVLLNCYLCYKLESQPVFLHKSSKYSLTFSHKLRYLGVPVPNKSINTIILWKPQKSLVPASFVHSFPIYGDSWCIARNMSQNFLQKYTDWHFMNIQNTTHKTQFQDFFTHPKLCLSFKRFLNNSQRVSIASKNCSLYQQRLQLPVLRSKSGLCYQERLVTFQSKMLRNSKKSAKKIFLRKLFEITNDTVIDHQRSKSNKKEPFSTVTNLLTGETQEIQEREEKIFLKKFNDKYDAIKEKHKKKNTIYLEDARVRHGEVIGGAVAAGTVIVTLWILKRSKQQRNHVNSNESYFTSSTEFVDTDDSLATSASSFFEQYWNHFENMVEMKSTSNVASAMEHPFHVSSYMIPSTITFRLAIARHLLTDLVIPYPSVSSLFSEDDSSCSLDSPTVFTTRTKLSDANHSEGTV